MKSIKELKDKIADAPYKGINMHIKSTHGAQEIAKFKDLLIYRAGGSNRWYKDITGEIRDGDSLFMKYKDGPIYLIDGEDISDVGIFSIYNNSFAEVELENGHKGIMFAYYKMRETGPNTARYWLKLIVMDTETGQFGTYTFYNSDKKGVIPKVETANNALHIITGEDNFQIDLNELGLKVKKQKLTEEAVKTLVEAEFDTYKYDYVSDIKEIRPGVWVAIHLSEDGYSFGKDTGVLVKPDGEIIKLMDTGTSNNYLHIDVEKTNENIVVLFDSKRNEYEFNVSKYLNKKQQSENNSLQEPENLEYKIKKQKKERNEAMLKPVIEQIIEKHYSQAHEYMLYDVRKQGKEYEKAVFKPIMISKIINGKIYIASIELIDIERYYEPTTLGSPSTEDARPNTEEKGMLMGPQVRIRIYNENDKIYEKTTDRMHAIENALLARFDPKKEEITLINKPRIVQTPEGIKVEMNFVTYDGKTIKKEIL